MLPPPPHAGSPPGAPHDELDSRPQDRDPLVKVAFTEPDALAPEERQCHALDPWERGRRSRLAVLGRVR
jgi:hypothetical protein